ncbi:hypothetical protein GWK47_053914 [Chionoecetes opilio]|uniref:Uncharacterized protein n=1 Tax=Chionoecetes opilio TaxID=41210 RepID=A0A8J4XYR8_CHIOP|nr:hypothetical protein GWK47_053914 [Chionoecetes opilio]
MTYTEGAPMDPPGRTPAGFTLQRKRFRGLPLDPVLEPPRLVVSAGDARTAPALTANLPTRHASLTRQGSRPRRPGPWLLRDIRGAQPPVPRNEDAAETRRPRRRRRRKRPQRNRLLSPVGDMEGGPPRPPVMTQVPAPLEMAAVGGELQLAVAPRHAAASQCGPRLPLWSSAGRRWRDGSILTGRKPYSYCLCHLSSWRQRQAAGSSVGRQEARWAAGVSTGRQESTTRRREAGHGALRAESTAGGGVDCGAASALEPASGKGGGGGSARGSARGGGRGSGRGYTRGSARGCAPGATPRAARQGLRGRGSARGSAAGAAPRAARQGQRQGQRGRGGSKGSAAGAAPGAARQWRRRGRRQLQHGSGQLRSPPAL